MAIVVIGLVAFFVLFFLAFGVICWFLPAEKHDGK